MRRGPLKTEPMSPLRITFFGCALGIVALSAALSRWFLRQMAAWERTLAVCAALLLIAPGLRSTLVGLALLAPVALRQFLAWRHGGTAAAA